MDNSHSIIADLDIIDDNGFPLHDNMRDPILLKNPRNHQLNWPLIAFVALAMLC